MFNDIKIAHFVIDDKFTDNAYRQFELVAPGCNDYYINSRNKNSKYLKDTPVIFTHRFAFKNPFFMKSLEEYDFVVLHSLTKFHQELVSHSKGKLKFVWIGMGYDYYDLIYDSTEELYLEKTSDIAHNFDNQITHRKRRLREFGKNIIYKNMHKKEVVKRIEYFSPVLESEYSMVIDKFDAQYPKYVRWNYGITAQLVDDESNHNRVTGQNILLGNSATLANNHIEVMEYLRHIDLNEKKIICPLSYGNDDYGDYIACKGAEYFGDGFISIREFMPYDDYMNIISSCSNVIMNHVRQQGGGNVSAMLFMGAKVFLNKVNPLHEHYTSYGAKLFTIEQLYTEPAHLDAPLSEQDIENNRAVTKSLVCGQTQIDKTINLIKQVSANT